jgi:phosphoribosyl 1,2-cyclic phosphodiesterase
VQRKLLKEQKQYLEPGTTVRLGDFLVTPFSVPHDASENVGYEIQVEGVTLVIMTDAGSVTEEMKETISRANYLIIEANHDVDMLMFGDYPYPVKVRIKGEKGHLSNDYAGDVLASILSDRKASQAEGPLRIMLAHLSFHNNAPLFARQTVEDRLGADGFRPGEDYLLEVAMKEGLTYMPQGKDEETC